MSDKFYIKVREDKIQAAVQNARNMMAEGDDCVTATNKSDRLYGLSPTEYVEMVERVKCIIS